MDRKNVVNLPIIFPEPAKTAPMKQIDFVKPGMSAEDLPAIDLPPGGDLELRLALNLLEGIHLTQEAPSKWMLALKDTGGSLVSFHGDTRGSISDKGEQVMTLMSLPDSVSGDSLYLYIKCVLYTCDDLNLCKMKETVYRQVLNLQNDCQKSKQLTLTLT